MLPKQTLISPPATTLVQLGTVETAFSYNGKDIALRITFAAFACCQDIHAKMKMPDLTQFPQVHPGSE